MLLSDLAGKSFGGLPDSLRWVVDLQERMAPIMKMQKQADDMMRMNRLAQLVASPRWANNALVGETARKLAAVARPVALSSSIAASAALVARFDALALKMPPDIGRQLAGLNGLQAAFFKDWSGLVEVARPTWLPQVAALQARFEHTLADFAELAEAEQEPAVLENVASASASVLSVGAEAVAAQRVTTEQVSELTAAFQQLTALQERQAAILEKQTAALEKLAGKQEETNVLLAQVKEQVTETRSKKLLNLLNTLLAIVGLLVSVLAYLESRKPQADPALPVPTRPAAEGSLHAAQAMLPYMMELLRQVSPLRTVAHQATLRSHPRRHGAVSSQLPPGTTVRLLYTRRQWALVWSLTDEEIASQGWVRKKYLLKARA